MIPISTPSLSEALLSEESLDNLQRIKGAVILVMIGCAGRFLLGDFSCVTSDLPVWILGVFLLPNDETLSPCYMVLVNSICRMCCSTGGLRLLIPYTVLCAVSTFFNLIEFLALPLTLPVNWFVLLSTIGEALGAYYGYEVFKQTAPLDSNNPEYMGAPSYRPPPAVPRNIPPAPMQAPTQQMFVPFGGTGQRLGA